MNKPRRRPKSCFHRRVENLPPKPVEILAGEAGIHAHIRDIHLLSGLANLRCLGMTVRRAESGQRTDRLLDCLVAVHRVAEPSEIRGVLPEDFGDGLAPVLAEGHPGFLRRGHIIFIEVGGEILG